MERKTMKPLRVAALAAQTEIGGGLMPRINRALRIAPLALCTALGVGAANAALPSGYTQLLYIESSGTQYINTGVVPKANTRVVCDFQFSSVPNATCQCGWGSSGGKETFLFGASNGKPNFIAYVSSTWALSDTGVPLDTARHVFDLASGSQKLDNTEFATDATLGNTATSGQTMYLFAGHVEWNPGVDYKCSMRIYSCKIYEGDTLVRDFVPVRQDSDLVVGLYDSANNTFYAGTGTFAMGDIVLSSDTLDITAFPDGIGSSSPAYGVTNGLAAGASFIVSCGATPATNAAGTMQYSCTGWKLYDDTGAVVSSGAGTSFNYVHPAAYRRLEWQWEFVKVIKNDFWDLSGYVDASPNVAASNADASEFVSFIFNMKESTPMESKFMSTKSLGFTLIVR